MLWSLETATWGSLTSIPTQLAAGSDSLWQPSYGNHKACSSGKDAGCLQADLNVERLQNGEQHISSGDQHSNGPMHFIWSSGNWGTALQFLANQVHESTQLTLSTWLLGSRHGTIWLWVSCTRHPEWDLHLPTWSEQIHLFVYWSSSMATLKTRHYLNNSQHWSILCWCRANEHTSSLHSGLHFGHYKAMVYSPCISHLHVRFTQLVFMTRILFSRYQSGLQVILEKKVGAIHIDLLQAILLMEANFNAAMNCCLDIAWSAMPFGQGPSHKNALAAGQNIWQYKSHWISVW